MLKTIQLWLFICLLNQVLCNYSNDLKCSHNESLRITDKVCENNCFDARNSIVCEEDKIKHVSCSYQLGPEFDVDDCLINFQRLDGVRCENRHITPVVSSRFAFENKNRNVLGDVRIRAYEDEDQRTNFHVEFSDIKWKDVTFKFWEKTMKRSVCRRYTVDKKLPRGARLFYDSPWTDSGSEGTDAFFELKYTNGDVTTTRNFTFIIPEHERLDKKYTTSLPVNIWLFSYVETTDLQNLILNVQIPPENILQRLNITSYDIFVIRIYNENITKIMSRTFSNSNATDGLYQFTYPTEGKPGKYFFKIVPFTKTDYEIDFVESRTPTITIARDGTLIGIVCGSGVLAILFIILALYQRHANRNREETETVHDRKHILFAYSSSHKSHINVVTKFAEVFKKFYNINVMLDYLDIPKLENKDPSTWMDESFNRADYVIFFLSPDQESNVKSHPYVNLFPRALNLMNMELSRDYSKKQFLLVSLPYSTEVIPSKLKNIPKYHLVKDLNRLLNKVQGKWFWENDFNRKDVISILIPTIHESTVNISNDFREINPVNNVNYVLIDEIEVPLVDDEMKYEINQRLNMQEILQNQEMGRKARVSFEDDDYVPEPVVNFQTLKL